MDKCSIQDHFNFTGKERELGRIANPAQRQHPQSQPNVAVSNILHDGDHADMDQIPINIVIGNNKPSESGNVKSTNFPTYRVVNFYRHEEPAFSMNMTCINKMVKRINNKNK